MYTRQEAEEIWNMAKDPDAYPDTHEDEINDYYEAMAEELVMAYVAGELLVPVEPCEHGYDREHIIDGTIAIDTGPWSDVPRIGFDRCPGPGAGIGVDDEPE